MWWSSTGEMVMAASSGEAVKQVINDDPDHYEHQDGHDGGEIKWAQRRQDPSEKAKVRLTHVTQKICDPSHPDRVGQPDPRRQNVRKDQEHVDDQKHVDQLLGR